MKERTKELCLVHLKKHLNSWTNIAEDLRLNFYPLPRDIEEKRKHALKMVDEYKQAIEEIESLEVDK